ncbi:MAG: hypothetical protein R2867_37075 [Caldilineaceae bacterium]
MIDFDSVFNGQRKIGELAADVTLAELKGSRHAADRRMVRLIRDLSDAEVVFVASDPEAEGGLVGMWAI